MYKEIMEMEVGKEFAEWLANNYGIGHGETFDLDEAGVRKNIKYTFFKVEEINYMSSEGDLLELDLEESIVNNLAIEFLDSKGVYITINYDEYFKSGEKIEVYYWDIFHLDSSLSEFYKRELHNRQEAIEQGVKKAFEILITK